MRRTLLLAAVSSVFLLSRADAQAPSITPDGDPSVNADTIYRLAVNPADYPEYAVALLLDDGVISVEADGRSRTTYRSVVQILKPDAEEDYQEQTFSYAPGHQRLTINWIRVVKPDGTVISAEPSHVQDSDVPASEGDPVYSDRKVRRVSLTGVKAGTIVDYSYTTEELKPFLPGDFYLPWRVNPGVPVRRSRYMVDVPASMTPRMIERNLDFKRVTRVSGGRRVYTWARANVDTVRGEVFAGDSNSVVMTVTMSAPITWGTIGAWYAKNAASRYALTPAVEQKLAEVVDSARTLDDSIRAVHRWVAQDIRYVSIALGLGGYQPRSPDEVVRTGFGDCKDKATLFIAALAKMGVPAYPVLLSSVGGVDRGLPSIEQLDHAIAAVGRGPHYVYTDLTADLVPYGEIPFSYQGEFGMVVHPDGRTEEITFPRAPIETNASTLRIAGTLSADGEFSGTYLEEDTGARAIKLRDTFRHPIDSTTRADGANAVARNFFENARGDSLVGFNGMDLAAPVRMQLLIRNGRAAEPAGDNMILRVPFKSMSAMSDLATELEAQPKRRFTIDPERFWGWGVSHSEFRLALPEGWKPQLPSGITATSAFGSYHSEYVMDGNELVIRRESSGARGIQPPESITDLIAWLRAVGRDNVRVIVLERTGAVQAGKP